MPQRSSGMLGMVVALAPACCERGVKSVVQAASRSGASAKRRLIKTNRASASRPPDCIRLLSFGSAECDDQDQRRERAEADPNPLLTRQTRSLQLIEIVRQLMQVLRRELRHARVHLIAGETASGKGLRH